MLNNDDRAAIEDLFSRLREVERRTDPRDPEAEALIQDEIARQPGAPYYMAQTILVQEHALSVAQRRIEELAAEVARAPRDDIFGGLFGGGRDRNRSRQVAEAERGRGGPWERQDRGGGFLAGAAQTALGVTGGMLLGSAIASMFGAGTATAAEPAVDSPEPGADDAAASDLGDNGFGGDDFDGGGFDFGGDF